MAESLDGWLDEWERLNGVSVCVRMCVFDERARLDGYELHVVVVFVGGATKERLWPKADELLTHSDKDINQWKLNLIEFKGNSFSTIFCQSRTFSYVNTSELCG